MKSKILQDINKNNPTGESVKYDDDYIYILNEISKLDSLSLDTKDIDSNKIIELSLNILENKSKDIFIAIYYSYALCKQDNISGLITSTNIIKTLLVNFGENLYPKSKIAKYNSFSWWYNHIKSLLNNIKIDIREINSKNIELLIENINFIENYINDNFDDQISFRELVSNIDIKINGIIKNKDQQKVFEESLDNSKKKEKSKDENISKNNIIKKSLPKEEKLSNKINSRDTIQENLEQESIENNLDISYESHISLISKNLEKNSSLLIKKNDFTIDLFILNRISIWSNIISLPKNNNNITYIKSPQTHEYEYIEKLVYDKKWNELLYESEMKVFEHIFWLDLNYYVYLALTKLNTKNLQFYELCINNYINTLPNIVNLKFEDKKPFANKETITWINKIKQKKNNFSSPKSQEEKKDINKLQKGFELVSKDQIIEAIKFFIQESKHSPNKQEETKIIIKLVNVLIQENQSKLASNYIDILLKTAQKYKLHKWEPNIAIEIYKLIINAKNSIDYEIKTKDLLTIKKNLASLDIDTYLEISK